MPLYQKGGHTVDCPPIFRCREHKNPLSFSELFCDELMAYAEGHVPSSLSETMRKHLGKRTGYLLPENLANPKIVLYNPENATGADALPFVTCRVNNRFIAIPSRYLTANQFDGCGECVKRQCRRPAPQEPFPPAGARPSRPPRPRGESQEVRRRGPRPGPDSGRRPPSKESKRRPTTSRLNEKSQAANKAPAGKPPAPQNQGKRPSTNRAPSSAKRGPVPPQGKPGPSPSSGSTRRAASNDSRSSRPDVKPVKAPMPPGAPPKPGPKPPPPPPAANQAPPPKPPAPAKPKIEEIDGIQLRDHA